MLLKSVKRGTRMVVHVTLDDFFRARGQSIEDCLSKAAALDRCLEQHQQGWERPSADEAIFVTTVPDDGKLHSIVVWAEQLREDILATIGHHASIGIACNLLTARIASRVARPRGLLLLLPGYETGFISSVSLEEFDELRPKQAAALRRQGVRTLGGLAVLSPTEARALLGSESAKLMGLVRGIEGRVDRARSSKLERAIGVLCRRTARRLDQGALGARALELSLVYRDGISLQRYTLMPRPAWSYAELESSAKRILRLFPSREQPVVGFSLTATGISPRPGQLPLFARPREVSVHLGNI